jgi:hypothetical protein
MALAAALLVFVVAVALERRRTDATRRRLRLVALGTALLALLALVARPARLAGVRPAAVTLLTPGASLADLAAATAAGLPVRTVPARPGEPAPPPAAEPLPDAAALARRLPSLARVRVAGHGLTAAEWTAVPGAVEAQAPPPLPLGAASLRWQRRLPLGGELLVSGRVSGVPAGGATATLSGPGLAPLRARLRPGEVRPGEAPLLLRGVPRGPGRQLLELRLEAAGLAPVVERLEVEVTEPRPPAVLWLEDAPSLESREVARWLQEAGAPLALRSRLSRGVERELVAGLNPRPALAPLSTGTLERVDLAVLDAGALAALSTAERAALAGAVERGGLGLLVRLGAEGAAPAVLGRRFALQAVPGAAELAAHLVREDGSTAPPLALGPRELRAEPGLVPLAADRAGRLLAAWRPAGAGAVAVTLVDGTWRWSREGSGAAFRRYWREVVSTLARPAPAEPRWLDAGGPALVDRPLPLVLETDSPSPPRAAATAPGGATHPLALRQDPDEPRRWSTTFWPRHAGWHRLEGGGATLWVHAAEPERWVALRLAERQAATAARAAAPAPPAPPAAAAARELVPLPRWPAFLVLVAALAVLWGEEAFSARSRRR